MRYKYRAVIFSHHKKVTKFLRENNRNFEDDKSTNIGIYYFYDDDPLFLELKKIMKKEHVISTITTEFSAEEMKTARWLSIRSKWLYGYCESDNYIEEIYDVDREIRCTCDKKQIENIRIPKDIKWGPKRYFCSINGVLDELIVNKDIVDLLKNSKLCGFSFRDLEVKSTISNTAKQLFVKNYLEGELNIEKTITNKIVTCKFCGRDRIITSGKEEHYYNNAFENINVDIIKSKSLFGEGGFKQIYISQNFYKFLGENKLDKNLVFEPIFLD